MNNPPELITERIVMRAIQLDDAHDVFGYVQNPNVLRYTTASPPEQFEETAAFVQSLVNQPDGAFAWSIRLGESKQVIGIIELGQYDDSYASLDYALSENYWNQGIMSEAVTAVLDWAFASISALQTITSGAMTANPASTRVQEKCGMTVQRVEQQRWAKFDAPVEVAVCSISREEWLTTQDKE